MSNDTESRPVVLVVGAEAVFQSLQSELAPERCELAKADHPAQARIVAGSRRPAVVVLALADGGAKAAPSLREVLPAESAILGLQAADDSEAADGVGGPVAAPPPPAGVDRLAPAGDLASVRAAVQLLLTEREQGQAPPSLGGGGGPDGGASEDRGGGEGSEAEAVADAVADADEEEEPDVDPSRAAAIRELGVAIRMERSLAGRSAGVGATKSKGPGLRLSHGGEAPSGDRGEDRTGAGVTDALSDLPDPGSALSAEEWQARVQAQRDAEAMRAALAQIKQSQSDQAQQSQQEQEEKSVTEEMEALNQAERRRISRRRWMILGAVGVAMLVAAGVAWYIFEAHQSRRREAIAELHKYRGKVDPTLAEQAQRARKRGVLVDPLAGLVARIPEGVRSADVDQSDEFLNRSVPELDRWFERALERLPKRQAREQLVLRAAPLVKFGQHKRAQRYLMRALKIGDGVRARVLLAQTFENQKQPKGAIYHLRRAVKLAPKRADLRARLGLQYLAAKRTRKACRALRAAARQDDAHAALVSKHCGRDGSGMGPGKRGRRDEPKRGGAR